MASGWHGRTFTPTHRPRAAGIEATDDRQGIGIKPQGKNWGSTTDGDAVSIPLENADHLGMPLDVGDIQSGFTGFIGQRGFGALGQ